MKPSTRDILFIFAGLFMSAAALWGAQPGLDARLRRDVAYLNQIGTRPRGAQAFDASLAAVFKADTVSIAALRKDRLGYGDISAAYAVASRLTGGATEANLRKAVAAWKSRGPGGWPSVAKALGVSVRRVTSEVESLAVRPKADSKRTAGAKKGQARADTLAGLSHSS
jgi:hypothetical protein